MLAPVLSVSKGKLIQESLVENPERVLKELVQKSLGELERAVLATPDGVALAVSNSSDFDDIIAALSAAVVAGVGDAFKQYFLLGVRDVTVELEDGENGGYEGSRHRCPLLHHKTQAQPRVGILSAQ